MPKPYRIRLTNAERTALVDLTRRGAANARHITRARILLLADGGASDQTIADALAVDPRTCHRLRKRACQEGALTALEDRQRPGAARLLDDNAEAHLIALACSDPPAGRAGWTMQVLADQLVALQIVPAISDETVRRTLKNDLKPWLVASWCIPEADGASVAAMEDVLAVYHLPYDPSCPTLCLDEYGVALTSATRDPLPARPGEVAKQDYEYRRQDGCTLFGAFEPHTGRRVIQVFGRRTRREFAQCLKVVLTEHYPEAERIRLVLDNLNTHTPGAFYETFPAAEARALVARIEWHFTPKHGSWLNMQEIEWALLKRQCLRHQRLASQAAVEREVAAWAAWRTERRLQVEWRFTIAEARLVMHNCYPIPSP